MIFIVLEHESSHLDKKRTLKLFICRSTQRNIFESVLLLLTGCVVMVTSTCSAAIQVVQPGDILLADLSGCAKLNIGVRDGNQGGLVVLRESIPETTDNKTCMRADRHWRQIKTLKRPKTKH